jgi:hypothetical protein
MFIWFLYPIAWGVADGGNVISPLKEMIFYGILDVLAKPVFCFYHAYALRGIPYERFMLNSGKASEGYGAAAAIGGAGALAMHEKGRPSTASNAPLAGNHNNATNVNNGGLTADHATGAGPLNGRAGLGQRTVSGRGNAEAGGVPAGGI